MIMKKYRFLIAAIICFLLMLLCASFIRAEETAFESLKIINWVVTGGDVVITRIGLTNPNIYEKNYLLSIPIKIGQVYLTNKAVDWLYKKNKALGYITIGIIDGLGAWVVYHNIKTITGAK